MNSLFETNSSNSILERLNALDDNTKSEWGKMDVSQMLKHCQGPLNIALKKEELSTKLGFIQKFMMSLYKPLLYNDKIWKHNLPTAKEFRITTPQHFSTEKEKLEQLIIEFSKKTEVKTWPNHPLFGYFTPEQWGKMQYKHLDHHLTQFNV
ncbi:DUF1569 domain-containing protein [Formosa sp. PL04]|uniref:DUF1569 domain-containing protein n=1 Tax=Formosa sp. PL04 TaxID=3081755 RepID=UPI002981F409|nr:DUF1569 domain-containing protein [Formosa sp. PL04]MDW5287785.1 DUF1569 domain-containing protein [Formosa sp. PL04]